MDLTQDSETRKLMTDAEAFGTRVNQLEEEVPYEYRSSALVAIARVNRDVESILNAYHEWDLDGVLDGTQALLTTQRTGFDEIQPYPYGSEAEAELQTLIDAVRQDWHQLRQRAASLVSA